ncbi:hypothetical protein K470DRAFT_209660 [Piedraia hortae CBS 480.64]|uniref:Large ribosomal subunit protein mL49 n=1 Tax=Piedraia hortae CBS 480.64 TaxID=1314780 RepID=A0A6A7CAS4_9PEZI|nr:hypothetical protein K470DRAFT_209660 [Piedraia hortae CBS 480.64]
MRHFIRQFSALSRRCEGESQPKTERVDADQIDPNLVASKTASPSYPPPSNSLPRPKESRASHRTSHPRPVRAYPTRQQTHEGVQRSKLAPEPVDFLPAEHSAPNLPYFVMRTRNGELPIYQQRKRGGNLELTEIKKVDGRVEALKERLWQDLGLKGSINPVTRHVVLDGHHKQRVLRYLRERRF